MASVGDMSVTETREDIPLKSRAKSKGWFNCSEDCLGGSRFINVAFGTLTVVITIALLIQINYGDYQVTPHGSVATDSFDCSNIGTLILKQNGNAVDAAIASGFCTAVTTPHVTGLDAEGQILIYSHRIRHIPNVIDFSAHTVSNSLPKLVLGLAYIHQQYGSLKWKDLVQPSVNLARHGFLISNILVEAIKTAGVEDSYGRLEAGQILKLEPLSETLQTIADIPEKELYEYIKTSNQPIHSEAIKSTFNDYDMYVPNYPSVGPSLLMNLEQIQKFNFSQSDSIKPEYTYRIAETTQITLNELNITTKFHEGTASNIAVMDLNDNYVSLSTGMYSLFGSGEMTSAGYMLDVKSKDKPCSRLPIILADANVICGRRMVFGVSDVTIATQIITSLTIANKNATESIEAPRFHILHNGSIAVEGMHAPLFNEDTLKYFETLSPNVSNLKDTFIGSNIVEKVKDNLNSHSDSRGGGIASRF